MSSHTPRPRHSLVGAGAAFTDRGIRISWSTKSGPGHALCDCGAVSEEPLPSITGRRAWLTAHRETLGISKARV